MPGPTKTQLYLAKSMGELNKLSEDIPKLTDARKALLSAEKLYKAAREREVFGDEEKAYVLYMRFFNVVKVIKKTAEYKKNEKYFSNLIGRKTCETAIASAEKLAESLNDRYDEDEAKKASEKIEMSRSEDEHKKKESEEEEERLKKEKEEEERRLKEEEEKKKPSSEPGLIGVKQLYSLLIDNNTSILIMDVRSQEHFYASHIKIGSCISVPFDIVPPGCTVTSIEKNLSEEAKGGWSNRGLVDHIILIDWWASLQSLQKGTPVASLKDAIFKWDSTTIIRSEPLVLDGGYENWLLHYPTLTTNANVTPPAHDLDLNNVPSLEDIDYDLDFLNPKSPVKKQNGVTSNGDVPLNNQADLKRLNSYDKNNLKDVVMVDKEPWNDKEKVDNRILSETRSEKVKNTNVITQGGRQPPEINRANKPQSFSKAGVEKPDSTVSEAEWDAIHQAKEIKRDELDRFERETKRLVAEQKARRVKLQDEERQLEKLAAMKKAELKETADLMREKRRIQQELDTMKQVQTQRIEEERKRQGELSKLKEEEEEKLSRMQEVERKRALRKMQESEEKAKKQEEEQRALEAFEKARTEREMTEKKQRDEEDQKKELAQRKKLEEEERRKKIEAEKVKAEKEAQEKARIDAEAAAANEKARRDAAAAAAAARDKAKQEDVSKSDGTGVPTSPGAINNNLPPGWRKVLEETTGRYGYVDLNGHLHWQPPIPDSPAKTATKVEQPQSQTYKTKLKDEDASSSSSGMKRSHSSPNIAKMVEEEKAPVAQPSFTRISKPKPAPVQVPQFIKATEVSAAKVRNLKPSWGSVTPGLAGLHNMGNTCYMNSIIQCLSNTSFLTAYFLHDKYRYDINRENFLGSKGEITEEFAVVVKALWSGQYRSITPCDFKETIARFNPTFAGYDQQDSQELLLFLMDGLHEDLNRIRKRPKLPELDTNNLPDNSAAEKAWAMHKKINDSIIVDLFQGLLKSTITCLTCRTSSSKFDAFMYLSLPIPSATRCSLRDCLRHFSKTEEMTGESRWNCPNCKCKRNAEKKIVIWKLPPVLLIHLKRFYYKGIWRQKITSLVDFPLDGLNLNEHVAGPQNKGAFKLYGVSNHYGTMEGGHYTAYCKHPANSRWFKYDDREVYQMDPSDVKTSAAYTLFYTSLHQELRLQ